MKSHKYGIYPCQREIQDLLHIYPSGKASAGVKPIVKRAKGKALARLHESTDLTQGHSGTSHGPLDRVQCISRTLGLGIRYYICYDPLLPSNPTNAETVGLPKCGIFVHQTSYLFANCSFAIPEICTVTLVIKG